MNAKKMLARYAQGGMVDEIGELRANMGGDISDARRMLQRFADGGEANQIFTDESTGERYFMVKGPDGKAYRSDRPIPGISRGLSPEEQAAYADSLRKSQEITALGMLQRVNALRQQEEALSPNKAEWFDRAQRLMKEDPNYQMLQRLRPELFDPVSSAVQEARDAYLTERAAPASQQLWESKVYQQDYGQGNVLDSVYRDPTTGYGVVSLRDPKGFVERGIVDQKGNFLTAGIGRAQDLLEDAQRFSPKFSENISSLLKSQGITPGVNDTFFRFQPYQQVSGEGTERTDTPFAQPVPTTTLLKDIPRTSPYQTQVDRMRELYENLSKRLKGVKGEPGMPGYTEERPFFAPFGFASGGSVAKNEKSEARRMLQNLSSPVQHFANGSEVSAGLQYARENFGPNAESIFNQNIRDFLAKNPDETATRAAMAQYGISESDVRNATGRGLQEFFVDPGQREAARSYVAQLAERPTTSQSTAAAALAELADQGTTRAAVEQVLPQSGLSAASQYALFNTGLGAAGAPGQPEGGIAGMDANIRAAVEGFRQQNLTSNEAAQKIPTAMRQYGISDVDIQRATGQSLADLVGSFASSAPVITKTTTQPVVLGSTTSQPAVLGSTTSQPAVLGSTTSQPAVLGSTTTSQPIILPPITALPPLQEAFVAPTAPPPSAPPPALTPGQEGLDPSTAIVKAIPKEERVTIPQLDTEFRASEPRTPTYDRFGRITGYTYSPAAKLTPATGTNVFNFVPPGITSRPRSLLNLGDVPGVMVDPVTGQMRLPLSASQQFARDRSTLDNQFRQLYARAAASDKSLPAQAPASAAAAFRSFVMSGEDPMLQNKLRFRDIEQQKYDPTKADPALRAQYGQSAFVSDLAAAFDPFLARNRAALTSLAEQQTPKSYSEQYPDIAEAYAKLKPEDKAKFPTLRDYELYHFDTYGRKEGRTSPLLGMGALQSPYAATFFSKGGEASTEDFIKKQSGGDVSRETTSPETRGVSSLKGYGEGEEAANIRRSAREALRGLVGMRPYEETNPSEAYRIASTATPFSMFGAGMAKAIPASKRLLMMPCCDMKGDVPAAAKQLYKGVFYQTYNKQARPGAEPNMVILSAKHGFVEPTKELAPYNQKMTAKQADELSANIQSSLDQVQWPTGIEEVMLVGGKEYQKVMRAAIKELQNQGKVSPDVVINATKGEIGEQRSQLGKYLREIPEQEPIEKQDGGEVTTEEFIKKNVSRGTSEVPKLTSEGQLIDENAEMRSESQRMLNRLRTAQQESYRRGKLPPGIQRAVTDVASEEKPPLIRGPVIQAGRDIVGGVVGATPTEPTNPSNLYRFMQAATGAALPEIPTARTAQAARVAAQEPRATISAARQSLEALGDIPVALAQPNQLGAQAGMVRLGGKESGNKPSSIFTPLPKADAPFVGRLDTFVAELPGPVRKDQFLGSLQGKFRDYEIKRAEEALKRLPDDAKLSPSTLLNQIKKQYDPSYYRTQVVEPEVSNFYYQMDNVYQGPRGDEFPMGVIHLIQSDNPQSASKEVSKKLQPVVNRTYGGLMSPEEVTETREAITSVFGMLTGADKRKLARTWTPYVRVHQAARGFEDISNDLIYPVLNKEFMEAKFKLSLASPIVQDAELAKIMQRKVEIAKDKYGVEGLDEHVPKLIQEHLGNEVGDEATKAVRELIAKRRKELNKELRESNADFRSVVRNIVEKENATYRGQHASLLNENNPIAFSRFSEHTTDIPGLGTTKGIYVNELQSDRLDDIRKTGPYGGNPQKDLVDRLIPLQEKQAQLLNEFVRQKLRGAPQSKLDAAQEELDAINKRVKREYERVTEGTYSLRESFPGMEESPQVIQQLMAKNVISAAINRGVNFVAFPGAESKQAQLYEKLPYNLKQVVKDLGPGFEFRPVTLKTPEGQEITHAAVVWGPEAANRIKQKGVPFKDGGEVNVPRETSTSKQQLDKLAQVSKRKKA